MFLSIYGVPYVIHTYHDTNIESNFLINICKLLGIAKSRTSQYHPQCDGQVERINRKIIEIIKLNVKTQRRTGIWKLGFFWWHIAVPYSLQLNSHRTICCTVKNAASSRHNLPTTFNCKIARRLCKRRMLHTLTSLWNCTRKTLSCAWTTKDYYDRRGHALRYQSDNPVWLWKPTL